MPTTYDVIVLGLGGMGSAAAFHLAGRGMRVLGLEQFTPAHDRGSSHGQSRIIREAYFEHPDYVPFVQRAYRLWQALEAQTGASLLRVTGGLMIGPADSTLVTGALASAQRHALPHSVLPASEMRERYPALRLADDEVAVFEPRAGVLFPEKCVQAHLQAAEQAGATLQFNERVVRWSITEGGVEVITERGRYASARLVITAGPWLSAVVPELQPHLRVERIPLYWFRPRRAAEQFDPDRFPIFIWERADSTTFYGIPRLDDSVKVAQHHSYQFTTPDRIDREVHAEEIETLRAILARAIPDLNGDLLATATCMYTTSPDEHFIIDRHPAYEQVVIAGGFSGHGFKFCSAVGELLANLTLDRTAVAPDLFRWDRLAAMSPSGA